MQQINNPEPGRSKFNYSKWLGIGFEFCGVLGVFCYLGYKADEVFNTSPWLLLAGFFVGFIGMFYTILKQGWNIRRK
jgi:F0F1-type ATP synthase assembly protein I